MEYDIDSLVSNLDFDSNKIIVYSDSGYITIKGKDLVVTKLLKDEVLITGLIDGIELR